MNRKVDHFKIKDRVSKKKQEQQFLNIFTKFPKVMVISNVKLKGASLYFKIPIAESFSIQITDSVYLVKIIEFRNSKQ